MAIRLMTAARLGTTRNRREPVLYFHTSNTEKFVQARILARAAELRLTQFAAGSEPYDEDYALAPRDMLRATLQQAVRAAGRSALVFVEDTTVRIEALSTSSVDVPGLGTKEWFQGTTFDQISGELDRLGGSRSASVRSDIALSIPGYDLPIFFHGETHGLVVKSTPTPRTHPLYTWLTTASFNGWFVPDGANLTLGEMEYEESLKYDFRAGALSALFERVREYSAALNFPPQAYRRVVPRGPVSRETVQLTLFPSVEHSTRSPLVVIGESCAGKTTFAHVAISRHDAKHVEASAVLVRLAEQSSSASLPNRQTHPAQYASALLAELGMDAIAEWIVEHHHDEMELEPSIITGLRTLEELRAILHAFPAAKVVHISSTFNMRYERYLVRKRGDEDTRTRDDFKARDSDQEGFGLLPVARDVCDLTIDNTGSLEEYIATASMVWDEYQLTGSLARPSERRLAKETRRASQGTELDKDRATRLSRCLALLRDRGPMTLPELEEAEGLGDHNASRILGFAPNTTRRDNPATGRVRWAVTDAGLAYLELVERP